VERKLANFAEAAQCIAFSGLTDCADLGFRAWDFVFRKAYRFFEVDRLRRSHAFEEGRSTRTTAPSRCAV